MALYPMLVRRLRLGWPAQQTLCFCTMLFRHNQLPALRQIHPELAHLTLPITSFTLFALPECPTSALAMMASSVLRSVIFSLLLTGATPLFSEGPELTIVDRVATPVLTVRSPGAEGNRYGFEGGRVLKIKGTYHLFTSEMVGNPHWVKMKLAHWTSPDRLRWLRVASLFESSGDFTGTDPRAALWSPLPVFDPGEDRWNLFYVAYQAAPDTPQRWLTNHEGRIWRAVSKTAGIDGIGGPYRNVSIILQRGADSDSWEGLQGTDSFFPYRVGDRWYAFYGSAHTERLPLSSWQVGLAWSSGLAGPWKRCTEMNPLQIEGRFIENPIVTRLSDGTYAAVYDTDAPNAIGYAFSIDGIHWSAGKHLIVQSEDGIWASEVRTPLGLVEEGEDSFSLFYTANEKVAGAAADPNGIVLTPGSIGLVKVQLVRGEDKRAAKP